MFGWQIDERGRLVFVNAQGQIVGTPGGGDGLLDMQPPASVLQAYQQGNRGALQQASTESARLVGILPAPATMEAWNDVTQSAANVVDNFEKSQQREANLRAAWQSALGEPPANLFAELSATGGGVSETALSELAATNPAYLNAMRRAGLDIPAMIELQRRERILDRIQSELQRRGAAVKDFGGFAARQRTLNELRPEYGRMGPRDQSEMRRMLEEQDEYLATQRPREYEAQQRRLAEEGLKAGTMQPYQTRNLTDEQTNAAMAQRPAWAGGQTAATAPASNEQVVAQALGLAVPRMAEGGRLPRYAEGTEPINDPLRSPQGPQPITPASGPYTPYGTTPGGLFTNLDDSIQHAPNAPGYANIGGLANQAAADQTTRIRLARQRATAEWAQVQAQIAADERLQMDRIKQQEAMELARIQQATQVQLQEAQRQMEAVELRHSQLEQTFQQRVMALQQALEAARLEADRGFAENPFQGRHLPATPAALSFTSPSREALPSRQRAMLPPPGVAA